MPPKRAPKGRFVQSSSAPKPTQSFNVLASGSRHRTTVRETVSSHTRRLDDAIPPENLLVLNQQIAEEWPDDERPAVFAPASSDQPTPMLAELENLMDDVQELPMAEPYRGKVCDSASVTDMC
ncbi:hypothetical protein FS749_007993 [Ceratobasidium sp. UAMH 11750]|nr:hypothetical protein FS749_007993 [Ceratobasidium sp. UAMH 11750]